MSSATSAYSSQSSSCRPVAPMRIWRNRRAVSGLVTGYDRIRQHSERFGFARHFAAAHIGMRPFIEAKPQGQVARVSKRKLGLRSQQFRTMLRKQTPQQSLSIYIGWLKQGNALPLESCWRKIQQNWAASHKDRLHCGMNVFGVFDKERKVGAPIDGKKEIFVRCSRRPVEITAEQVQRTIERAEVSCPGVITEDFDDHQPVLCIAVNAHPDVCQCDVAIIQHRKSEIRCATVQLIQDFFCGHASVLPEISNKESYV